MKRAFFAGAGVGALAALSAACALAPEFFGGEASGAAPSGGFSGDDGSAPSRPPEAPDGREALFLKDLDRIPTLPVLAELAVPGFPDAVLSIPIVEDEARPAPVVLVLHGLRDRPEPHCAAWRTITSARAFVVCPRGARDGDSFSRASGAGARYTLPGGEPLRAHVDAALTALSARFGARVDATRPLLAGFSLGATEAALLAQADAGRFPRVAVLEGGLDVWIGATIAAFGVGGGRRVLFGCGSPWCTPPASEAIARIDQGGVGARMAFADVGHRPDPALQVAIREQFAWFVEGDPRWSE